MTGLEFVLVLTGAYTLADRMMRFVRFIETGK